MNNKEKLHKVREYLKRDWHLTDGRTVQKDILKIIE